MKTTILSILGGLSCFTTAIAATSTELVKNYCNATTTLFLTIYSNGTTDGPFSLGSQQAYLSDIVSVGGTVSVSKNTQIYSPDTPKMVLGASTNDGILYWSINNVSGDPFADTQWSVTSSGTAQNICSNTSHYGSTVYACQDNAVTLTLSLC